MGTEAPPRLRLPYLAPSSWALGWGLRGLRWWARWILPPHTGTTPKGQQAQGLAPQPPGRELGSPEEPPAQVSPSYPPGESHARVPPSCLWPLRPLAAGSQPCVSYSSLGPLQPPPPACLLPPAWPHQPHPLLRLKRWHSQVLPLIFSLEYGSHAHRPTGRPVNE